MYEYMSSFVKFQKLPAREEFYSSLNGGVSEEVYEHTVNVWNTFNIATIEEYHNLYLLTDVLLLDEVLLA